MAKSSLSTQRVQAELQKLNLNLQIVELPDSTHTAVEAAQAVGCQVGQIAKSLVFKTKTTNRPVLVITSGANRVNEKLIGRLVGEKITKADADFVRQQTGFAIGGVSPVGHLHKPLTFIDQDLLQYKAIWAAAGTPHAVFKLTGDELLMATGGLVIAVK